MIIDRNLKVVASNYISKFWSLISVFLFIPIYIKYLGIEAYAIIGFYSLILGIITFADSGLSSAIIKEFASTNTPLYKYSILRLLERIYIPICSLAIFIICVAAPFIAKKWLNAETIPTADIIFYIRLIAIGTSLQLLSSLYFGAIYGFDYQVEANVCQLTWAVMRSAGAILALILISKTLKVFFISQIVTNLLYVIFLRIRVIVHLKSKQQNLFIIITKIPKHILSYVVGMILISILSSINSQADKIITSTTFTLKIYAYYCISSVLAQLPMIIATPIASSFFPVFAKLVSEQKLSQLSLIFSRASYWISVIVFTGTTILVLYTKEIIILWTKNSIEERYFSEVVLATKFLVIGSAFLALQLIHYYLLLAHNKTKYNVIQGLIQLGLGIPILYFLICKIGILGAGASWIIINSVGYFYLLIITLQNFVLTNVKKYILETLIIPFSIICIICLLLYFFYTVYNFYFLAFAFISGVLTLGGSYMYFIFIKRQDSSINLMSNLM